MTAAASSRRDQLTLDWRAALAHAEISESAAVLFVLNGATSTAGESAKTWPTDTHISDPVDLAALGTRACEANDESVRRLHRVAVWPDRTREGVAASLRHELEHCRQFTIAGVGLEHLHYLAVAVLASYAGGVAGSGVLYNAIPMEIDANAAASRFVRARFGNERIDELVAGSDHDAALFRATEWIPAPESLVERMDRFIREDGPTLAQRFMRAGRRSSSDEAGSRDSA